MVRHLLASRNTRFVINSAWQEPDSKYSQAVPRTQSVPLRRCTNYNRNTVDIYSYSLGSAVLWRTHDVRTNLVTCARCASFFFRSFTLPILFLLPMCLATSHERQYIRVQRGLYGVACAVVSLCTRVDSGKHFDASWQLYGNRHTVAIASAALFVL